MWPAPESSVFFQILIPGIAKRGASANMTWIRTVSLAEADEKLRRAIEGEKLLYPREYAEPVHPDDAGGASIRGLAYADSGRAVSRFQHVRGADVAGLAAGATAARDDRDYGLGDQPVRVLNRVTRRVSA